MELIVENIYSSLDVVVINCQKKKKKFKVFTKTFCLQVYIIYISCLVLEFSCITLAKSLKEAVADPWPTKTTKLAFADLYSVYTKNKLAQVFNRATRLGMCRYMKCTTTNKLEKPLETLKL